MDQSFDAVYIPDNQWRHESRVQYWGIPDSPRSRDLLRILSKTKSKHRPAIQVRNLRMLSHEDQQTLLFLEWKWFLTFLVWLERVNDSSPRIHPITHSLSQCLDIAYPVSPTANDCATFLICSLIIFLHRQRAKKLCSGIMIEPEALMIFEDTSFLNLLEKCCK